MNKKVPLWMAISVSLLAAIVVMVCTLKFAQLSYGKLSFGDSNELFSKLSILDDKVKQNFYGKTDDEKLTDAMMEGYIDALDDDYAEYFSVEETKKNTNNSKGVDNGIGISFVVHPKTQYLYVTNVHKDSPADKAGIRMGDSVVSIAGVAVNKENYTELVEDLHKSNDQTVSLTYIKSGEKAETPIEIVPTAYDVQTVWASMIDTTAYIQISRFSETTPKQLKSAMKQVKGAEAYIFDVRSNPGGIVDALAEVLDYLLPSADIIKASYYDGSSKVLYSSDQSAALKSPAVVLTNSNTASCAELFASAMRDVAGAKVIGEKTFGKSVMQTTFTLKDGSSFKFTTAKLTTPSGAEINKKGISPDVKVEQTDEEKLEALVKPISDDPVVKKALEELKNDSQER